MQLLHLIFYIPVNVYLFQFQLFTFEGNIPDFGLSLVLDLPLEAFVVWHALNDTPQDNHIIHLLQVTPLNWK